ncbi:putative mRNA 3-end processing factor [Filimonas lacunae]|uniref:Putative mRNA 3-end processing factor n=1 Tax=Filimonas lacunae TaxID=477680 RepID=A0A173MAI8_9BACT|nr:ligase-associated DNA damage response exonuclease [Filimonas lacunae]BAV04574.1 mRNA 3-end processing factor [Filimonas lacunae]SIT32795.1 putative mRNA 3-end processing factor [Filimonas lacunae]
MGQLLSFTDKGLYCPAGDFYIDPWRPVAKAVITHAHSDHARWGHQYYLCHTYTKPILQARLGNNHYETVEWDEPVFMNGVKISLHPAGHIIGSSQIRLEYKGEVWVVSGDYKTEDDGISGAFTPIPCHAFITESTFGLPIYNWKKQADIYNDIRQWVTHNQQQFNTSVIIGYSLGKAQRIITALAPLQQPIYVHGAIWNMQQAIASAGIVLPEVIRVTPETSKAELKNSIVIAPSSAEDSPWMRRFSPYRVGVCSGWMQVRGNVRRHNADAGFTLSDHADWNGLLSSIAATGAEKVYVTHGFQSTLSRYLNEKGIWSAEVKTEYGGEEENAEADTITPVAE